jgi:nicotinamidase-related amidase
MDSLKKIDKKFVIISGIEAHVCVLQTVLDLLEHNYVPVVVENCISSRKSRDKKTAVERMKQEGAVIATYESILFELTRFAGTSQFKEISRLVK